MKQLSVGGIILAAGLSSRMKQPKLLLPFGAENTIIGVTIDQARAAGLDDLGVISGANREQVEAIAAAKNVRCVYNPDFAQGQSTSLKCGLNALAPDMAAMFILGDQPQIPARVYRAVAEAYRLHQAAIVVPRSVGGERGNPSLFAPEMFAELRRIEGDVGGRPVLRKYIDRILYVETDEISVLQDIDTAEQYTALTGLRL
jgi:molybdenum cofactor cytidylyltransferase